MRGKKAKQIRRLIYGDYSYRLKRYRTKDNGQIVSIGHRSAYQKAKKSAGVRTFNP